LPKRYVLVPTNPFDPTLLSHSNVDEVKAFIQVIEVLNYSVDERLAERLEIKELLYSKISSLSGGELQRVALYIALSQDVDIYLLDEPSAFLDVFQRMNLFKLLQKMCEERNKTVMLIDHDLLFISFCDRAMLFKGVPARKGYARFYDSAVEALNEFLRDVNVTFRRDKETLRPRANKPGSRKDREQKEMGVYFEEAPNK
jgi:ATP-binding cassette subfamily E protein 1